MTTSPTVEIKVLITSLNIHYKEPKFIGTLDFSSNSMKPTQPQRPPEPEIDPNHVVLSFNLADRKGVNDHSGGLLLKTEDAKKLNLMVGDTVTIRLSKDAADITS